MKTTQWHLPRTRMTSGQSSLVIPNEAEGDRPFDQRPYGRVRLNEAMAHELERLCRTEIDRLLDLKAGGRGLDELNDHSLRNVRKILNNVIGMKEEKGW